MSPFAKLINICSEALEDTMKWQRSAKRTMVGLRFWSAWLVIGIGASLAFGHWPLALIWLAILGIHEGISVREWRQHQADLVDWADEWSANLDHWRAAEMEWEETGEVGEWAFHPPSDFTS